MVSFKTKPNAKGSLILGKDDQSKLATFIKDCELQKKNLASTQGTLEACQDKACSIEVWQTPVGVVSIGFGSLLLGAVLAHNL